MARVTATVATFNSGRTSENGFYAISIATPYRRYYALWRIFADERPPLFIRTLADTFVMAAGKAMDLLKYCKVTLKWVDNTFFIPYYEQTYDTLTFGKYRGKRIAEVYYIDPNYVLWMANRFEPEKKKLLKLKETAQCFAVVHAGTRGTQSPATACLSFAQPLRRGERRKTGSPPTENLICQTASGHLQAGLLYRPTHSGRRQPRKPLYFH